MFYRTIIVLYSITIVFSVASELRIGGLFGVSEFSGMLFLLFSVFYLAKDGLNINYPFLLFSISSLFILVISSIFNSIKGNPIEIRDFFAYTYAWLLTNIFISLILNKPSSFGFFLKSLVIIGFFYCLFINVGSFYFENFIYQGLRLSGWSTNPNQFALLLALLIGAIIYFKKIINLNNKVFFSFMLVFIVTSLRTFSDALILSLLSSSFVLVAIIGITRIGLVKFTAISCLIFSISIFSLISFYDQIPLFISIVFDGMNENSQGDDRLNLWKNGIYSIENSLLFGNGTGAHSGAYGPFENFEAHNTYIDWSTQTGLVGLCILLILLHYCFLKSISNTNSRTYFYYTLICVFIVFHFVLRQPIFWLYIMLPVISHNLSLFNNSKTK